MRKHYIISLAIILISTTVFAQIKTNHDKADYYLQNRGEVCFSFNINSINELETLTKIVSIDKFNKATNTVVAYANKQEFENFLKLGKTYNIAKKDNEHAYQPMFERINGEKATYSWNTYPTYTEYLQLMSDFQTNHPSLCKLVNIGSSVNGRDLLAVKLSDNVSTHEQEPRFLYVGTIHGDETAGYIILMRLIDYFLTNYGTDAEVTSLLDNTEIWISPLSNPDGTYYGGNSTVSNARRYNANSKDLNRNFMDPDNGFYPTGAWQPETQAYMNFVDTMHFVMSANTHGGDEVVNYPFDTYYTLNANDDWWKYVSHHYADTAQYYGPSGFFDGFNDGTTNGAAWYSIAGGRQDYMNYYNLCREVTLELSNVKLVATSELENQWNYHHRSLINYLKEVHYGVKGVITDAITGQPIEATVFISGHDYLRSYTKSELPYGDYYRPTYADTVDITFSAPCYKPQTITGVVIANKSTVVLDVQLLPISHDTAIVSDAIFCVGDSATFTASTSGTAVWYDALTSTIPIFVGDTFTTPVLNTNTDYWVENHVQPVSNVGSIDYTLNGAFRTDDFYTIFDCFEPVKLTKVTVNANNSGNIVIQLLDNQGILLDVDTVYVPQYGVNILDVDIDIPEGRDLRLYRVSADMGLHRNNASVAYPYELKNLISIKRSSASSSKLYYYYFYNWEIQEFDCTSNRIKVSATLGDTAKANFSFTQSGGTVDFTNLSISANSYYWDFGDGHTSTDTNHTNVYSTSGPYIIKLIAYGDCGNDTITDTVDVIVNINEEIANNIKIYPNPASKSVQIESGNLQIEGYSVYDIYGKELANPDRVANPVRVDVSTLPKGVYFIKLQTNKGQVIRKFVKE